MVLSKSNMDIAKQYADLCEDEDTKKVFDTIYQEWKLTKEFKDELKLPDAILQYS